MANKTESLSGLATSGALANRISLWLRTQRNPVKVDFFRVMKGDEHLDDFEAGPESADDIGTYGSLLAEAAGAPVTLEIIAMRRGNGEDIFVRTIMLRCVPPPPPPVTTLAEMSISQVMVGYVAMQSASVEMMRGVTAALSASGEITAQIITDGAAREAAMRAELEEMHGLIREALEAARAAKAAAVPASRGERVERLVIEMLGAKAEQFAKGFMGDSDVNPPEIQ